MMTVVFQIGSEGTLHWETTQLEKASLSLCTQPPTVALRLSGLLFVCFLEQY